MDLDEWELLPREETIHHQTNTISILTNTKTIINMNYFQSDQIYKESSDGETIPHLKKKEDNEFTSRVELEEKDGEEEEGEGIKKEEDNNDKSNGGLNNVLKWGMNGIGAVFSFGFVVASVSLVALCSRSSAKDHHSCNTSEIRFQIYSHDKRMKRVVKRTKRLNEAIAAVRGAPYMTRAHITIGGSYEGL